jgi:hypothetical protein
MIFDAEEMGEDIVECEEVVYKTSMCGRTRIA